MIKSDTHCWILTKFGKLVQSVGPWVLVIKAENEWTGRATSSGSAYFTTHVCHPAIWILTMKDERKPVVAFEM